MSILNHYSLYFHAPFLKQAWIDQTYHELCVAASFAQAMFLSAFGKYSVIRSNSLSMPCCWVMYQRGCYNECLKSGRCSCAKDCTGICDPNCGTTITSLIDIIPSRPWVSANLQFVYQVRRVRQLNTGDHAYLLSKLQALCPVVVNLFLFANQVAFFENHTLLVSGSSYSHGTPKSKMRDDDSDLAIMSKRPKSLYDADTFTNTFRTPHGGIASPLVLFPKRQGAKQSRGHCVLAVGYFVKDDRPYIRLRNSFGARWGVLGDFAMALEDFCEDQVHLLCCIDPDDIHVEFSTAY